jgi:hypothetical protein
MSKYRVKIYKEIGYSFDVEVETKLEYNIEEIAKRKAKELPAFHGERETFMDNINIGSITKIED